METRHGKFRKVDENRDLTRRRQNNLKKVETLRPVETRSIDAMANESRRSSIM